MAERPVPFPRHGERLLDGRSVPKRVAPDSRAEATPGGGADELWVSLTSGGRILVCLVAAIGVLGLLGAAADAIFGGVHGDQAGGVFGVFVVLLVGLLFGVVIGLDAAFRAVRGRVTNSRG